MVVIIAGSRSFTDRTLVHTAVRASGWLHRIQLIISGGAAGIDTLAASFATAQAIPLEIVRAEWSNTAVPGAVVKYNARGPYNAAAGMLRNESMAAQAIAEARSRSCTAGLILIWDGTSSGSAQMRRTALKHKLALFEYIPTAHA